MSLSIEVSGSIHHIAETVFVTDKFSKREFVIHISDEKNAKYDDYLQLQMTGDNCDKLTGLLFGDKVKCQVNVRGREWEKKDGSGKAYFNTLEAWKIEVVEKVATQQEMPEMPQQATAEKQPQPQTEAADGDLPF